MTALPNLIYYRDTFHSDKTMEKPFSQACENNKQPILQTIKPYLVDAKGVLEIGSGTGQHAVYFAKQLPHLQWHTSDVEQHHVGINMWLAEAQCDNLAPPIPLNVNDSWPELTVDAIYTSNTLHIMSWPEACRLIMKASELLPLQGYLLVYGPFNYNGEYTAESNRAFDQMLRERDALSGLRDMRDVTEQMNNAGFVLIEDAALPANNRCLIWQLTRKL